MLKQYIPKTFIILKEGYTKDKFLNDFIAGIIVGIVALPLSIALAIASGVGPEKGLYTAIIGGFIISFFGGSRVQIGGPTGAFVIIIYGIIQKYGYNGLVIASIMAGVILIFFGLFRLGTVIKYIPYPVTVGFTTGIALLIFTSQIKDFFGLNIENLPGKFIDKIKVLIENLDKLNIYSLSIGLLTIIISLAWNKKFKKVPGSLISIIITTVIVLLFKLPVETIGSQFGSVPNTFEKIQFPNFTFKIVKELFYPSLTIALLAGIESLLSAVVADGMIGTKHNSNMELIAQGLANIFSPIFGGIPATGAIARTATNIKSGGRTPLAGIVHSIVLLFIMLFLGKLAILIPMSTLAGILIIVSYNMSELGHFIHMKDAPKSDGFVLIITFLLTVFSDLTVAIQFGVIASSILFMKRMSDLTESSFITDKVRESEKEYISDEFKELPKGIEIFELNGPLFFGAASYFQDSLKLLNKELKVLIISLKNVPFIDATGLNILKNIIKKCSQYNIHIVICGLASQPRNAMKKSKLIQEIGEDYICTDIDMGIFRGKKAILDDYYSNDDVLLSEEEKESLKIFK